jgi:hypothetical protein
MDCANEFNIWGDYGRGVTHAADACNLEINLKSNGTETASTDSASETTAAAASVSEALSPTIKSPTDLNQNRPLPTTPAPS